MPPLLFVRRSGQFGLEQPVASIATPVDHAKGVAGGVVKGEKVVPQQLHLFDGLIHVHWARLELFHAHEFAVGLTLRLGRCGLLLSGGACARVPVLALVACNLAFNLVNNGINRSLHIRRAVLGA